MLNKYISQDILNVANPIIIAFLVIVLIFGVTYVILQRDLHNFRLSFLNEKDKSLALLKKNKDKAHIKWAIGLTYAIIFVIGVVATILISTDWFAKTMLLLPNVLFLISYGADLTQSVYLKRSKHATNIPELVKTYNNLEKMQKICNWVGIGILVMCVVIIIGYYAVEYIINLHSSVIITA